VAPRRIKTAASGETTKRIIGSYHIARGWALGSAGETTNNGRSGWRRRNGWRERRRGIGDDAA